MNTAGNPMQVITGKLDAIISKLDGINTGSSGGNDSNDIAQIKRDINDIAKSMATLASSVETEDVRNEKKNAMVKAIVDGVNGKIGSLQNSMSSFDQKVKNTRFTASLPKDQAQSMRDLVNGLSPDSQSKFVGELKDQVKQLQEVSKQVSKENLQKTLEETSKEWVRSYKETLKKEVEDTYKEVEGKRENEGKAIVVRFWPAMLMFFIMGISICFGFWGVTLLFDQKELRWILIALCGAVLFISCIWAYMKFKMWSDDRRWRF